MKFLFNTPDIVTCKNAPGKFFMVICHWHEFPSTVVLREEGGNYVFAQESELKKVDHVYKF